MEVELLLEESSLEKPWWNRPLLGNKSLLDYVFPQQIKTYIPSQYLSLYDQAIEKIENISLTLKALFNEKFAEKDFLVYARIQCYLDRFYYNKKHYFLIGKEFFKPLLDNLEIFIKLYDIEKEYNQYYFIEFYNKSLDLIKQYPNKLIFQEKLKRLKQLINEENTGILDESEQQIINIYSKYLYSLSEKNNLLNIFYELKINYLNPWRLLIKVKEFIDYNIRYDIEGLKSFVLLVKTNEEEFKEISSKIFKIRQEENEDFLTISGILQYVTLSYKYEQYYGQFQLFLNYLSKWEKIYFYLLNFREKYSKNNYYQPASFKVKISGFDLYKNYHDYLDSTYLTSYYKRSITERKNQEISYVEEIQNYLMNFENYQRDN